MKLGNLTVAIADHPLGKEVKEAWDRELSLRNYDKDMNVCELDDKTYKEISTIIDRQVAPWFRDIPWWEKENLKNAWDFKEL